MFINYIWRNCYPSALEVPLVWKNKDLEDYPKDKRIHALYVALIPKEIQEQILPLIKDDLHKLKIAESCLKAHTDYLTHNFLIGCDCSFIQFYPYFSLYESGSLFDSVKQVKVEILEQLMQAADMLNEMAGDL